MAPRHDWYDALFDAGWDRALLPAGFRLLMRIARRVDRNLQTRTKLARLRQEAGLSEPGFYAAKRQLIECGLMRREKTDQGWVITLTFPIPNLSAPRGKTLRANRKTYSGGEPFLSKRRGANRQKPTQTAASADDHQQTKTQLRGQTETDHDPFIERALELFGGEVVAIVSLAQKEVGSV